MVSETEHICIPPEEDTEYGDELTTRSEDIAGISCVQEYISALAETDFSTNDEVPAPSGVPIATQPPATAEDLVPAIDSVDDDVAYDDGELDGVVVVAEPRKIDVVHEPDEGDRPAAPARPLPRVPANSEAVDDTSRASTYIAHAVLPARPARGTAESAAQVEPRDEAWAAASNAATTGSDEGGAANRQGLNQASSQVVNVSPSASAAGGSEGGGNDHNTEEKTGFEDPEDPNEGDDEDDDVAEDELEVIEGVPDEVPAEANAEIEAVILTGDRAQQALSDGDVFAEIAAERGISDREELATQFWYEAAEADRARDRLVTTHGYLATWGARRFGRQLPLDDACSAAYYGIFKAAQRFDPSHGHFSAYAAPRVKREVLNEVYYQAYRLKLPRFYGERLFQVRRARTQLHMGLGRLPTDEEVAAELNMDVEFIQDVSLVERRLSMDARADEELWLQNMNDASSSLPPYLQLDRSIGESAVENDVVRHIFNQQLREVLAEILPKLAPAQQETLRLLTGVGEPADFKPMSIAEMGQAVGLNVNSAFARAQSLYGALRRNRKMQQFLRDVDSIM